MRDMISKNVAQYTIVENYMRLIVKNNNCNVYKLAIKMDLARNVKYQTQQEHQAAYGYPSKSQNCVILYGFGKNANSDF